VAVNIALFHDLDSVARDAAGALDRARRPCLFDRLAWFRLIAEHCPPPGMPAIIRAEKGDRRAWLFLSIAERKAVPFSAWYSLRFGAIGDGQDDVMTAIAAALRDGGIAQVSLGPIESPAALEKGFRDAGWKTRVTRQTGNWRIRTSDFGSYWAARPARLQNTYKRRAKAAGLTIEIHDRFDDQAWADYESVYRSSWKPEEGSFGFLRALAEQEGAAGTLRLGIAASDGRPVAAQLWLVENGHATIHKLAYAEDMKALSPGTILGHAMFRHVIDTDRVGSIDYGTGDEAYKADWMDECIPLWRLEAHKLRTLAGLFGAARARAGALAARWRSR
jgi:hypothetical protein